MGAGQAAADNVEWHDVAQWGVEGREFLDAKRLRCLDRLRAAAEATVTKKKLAGCSSPGGVRRDTTLDQFRRMHSIYA